MNTLTAWSGTAPLLLAVASCFSGNAVAQANGFPARQISIVVPYPAGGGADTVARLLATNMAKHMHGQAVIVDNRAGASGNIGASYVSRANADGYTLLLTNSTMTINASLGFTKGYDVKKDLQPIALLVSSPVALGVNHTHPAKSSAELVDYVRKNPGTVSYSSCGNGSPQHFSGAAFNQSAKLDMVHIPYNGCAPAVSDGIGNQVPVLFSTIPNMAPHAKSGKLRILGVASAKRLSFMPDMPTISETPAFKNMDISVWFGLFAPKALPDGIKSQLESAILKTMADPKLQEEFRSRYYEVEAKGIKGMAEQVDRDIAMYTELAKQANIKLE